MSTGNLYKLLDKLEIMILKGMPVPLTPLNLVNHEKVIDTVDKVRASLPGEIQEAHSVLKRKDDIILDAQKKANQVLTEAKQQAEMLLSESELLRAVQSEAERIRQQVISECELMKKQTTEEVEIMRTSAINESIAIKDGADKYAESILSNLDRDLTELHNIVRNGQKHLSKMKADSVANMTSQKTMPQLNNVQNIQKTVVK